MTVQLLSGLAQRAPRDHNGLPVVIGDAHAILPFDKGNTLHKLFRFLLKLPLGTA